MSRNRKKGKAKQAIGLLHELLTMGKLKSDHAVKVGIRQILPDAQILHVETGTRAKGRKIKRFTVILNASNICSVACTFKEMGL